MQLIADDAFELFVELVLVLRCGCVVVDVLLNSVAVVDLVVASYWKIAARAPKTTTRPTTTAANAYACVLALRTFQSQ